MGIDPQPYIIAWLYVLGLYQTYRRINKADLEKVVENHSSTIADARILAYGMTCVLLVLWPIMALVAMIKGDTKPHV